EEQDREVLFQHGRIHPSFRRLRRFARDRLPPANCCRLERVSVLPCLVPTGRLELPRLTPLPPQDSVSTNSTTSAISVRRSASNRTPSSAPQVQPERCPAVRRPASLLSRPCSRAAARSGQRPLS